MARIPNYSNLTTITESDLHRLVDDGVSESASLDFKEQSNYEGASGRREWCKDISAMANAEGGCILIGVSETDQVAQSIEGVDSNTGPVIERLQQLTTDNIAPRISLITHTVELENGRSVILLATTRSAHGPHRNTCNDDQRYYRRAGTTTVRMDHADLGTAFSRAQQETLTIAENHELWSRDNGGSGYSLSFTIAPIPIETRYFPNQHENREPLKPLSCSSWDHRICFDGLLCAGDRSHAILRRDGSRSYRYEDPSRPLGTIWIMDLIAMLFDQQGRIAEHFAWHDPCIALFTMHVFDSVPLAAGFDSGTIAKGKYLFDALYFDSLPADPHEFTAGWIHQLWNAGGFRRCPFYDADGKYIEPRN